MVDAYHIKSISDIGNIPEDRLDAFFADFKDWLSLQRKIMDEFTEDEVVIDEMEWYDDGIPGISKIEIRRK